MNCEICGNRFDEMPENGRFHIACAIAVCEAKLERGIVARNRVAVDLAKHFVEGESRRTVIYAHPSELGRNAIVKITLEYVGEV